MISSDFVRKCLVVEFILLLFLLFTGRVVLAFLLTLLVSGCLWLVKFPSFPALTMVEKIQHRLKLDFVKVSISKISPRRVIGGFMFPIAPFYAKIKYKDDDTKIEAIFHELSHIWYFIYGFQLSLLMLLIFLFWWFNVGVSLKYGVLVVFMLLQEYLAFTKARKEAYEFGIKTRKFTYRLCMKYLFLYSVAVGMIWFILYVLNIFILFKLLLLFALYHFLNWAFYYLFRFIDMIWKHNADKTKDL